MTRTHLKHLCLDSYSTQDDDERNLERFCASPTFLHDLERGQGFCLRMLHKERRTLLDEEYTACFLNQLNGLSNDYPPDLVFNMDDTCWRLFESPTKVLAEKEAETVKLQSKKSEKTSFTAHGAISVTGQKLPLWPVAKGTTPRCERKFGTHPNVFMKHTDSGWTTENLIIADIEWLDYEIAKNCPCVLVLDIHPSHRRTLLLPLLKQIMWSYCSFPPAQQKDSNPSVTEYSGSLKLAHEQNLGDECG
jgi:hypothetical protein